MVKHSILFNGRTQHMAERSKQQKQHSTSCSRMIPEQSSWQTQAHCTTVLQH
jgi:hypothetical protein